MRPINVLAHYLQMLIIIVPLNISVFNMKEPVHGDMQKSKGLNDQEERGNGEGNNHVQVS